MSKPGAPGTAEVKVVKAGCGIRFDPDTIDAETGFDFSGAQALLGDGGQLEECTEALPSEAKGAAVSDESGRKSPSTPLPSAEGSTASG